MVEHFITGLRLVEVRIPNYVIKGSAAQLECLYDLDGEALYSVKWYKDGNEFYRYVPRDMPPAQTFLLPGVKVDLHNSSDAIVTLRDVNLQSAGRFRCEVSGEAPSFQTVTEHGDMVVVSLPDQGPPKISGGRPRYQTGDWVRINCTAGRSKPAVDLSWFVNGEAVEPQKLRKYDSIVSGREGLETSVLGLQFRVEQKHFRNGDMKLKCVASLSTLYWRSNEESVEGDRPQKAPVLESRETVYASNSRADPRPSALLLVALAAVAALAGGGISVPQSINKDHQEDEKERKKQRKHEKNLNERVSGVELSELLACELLADFEGKSACQSSATRRQHRGVTVTAR
ncbi:GL22402 [Drosophila persimilis]|uniref:GL22402 n=1 Tax=Drosophila persimilis TaxID=7234 RepID=B4HCC9_DROPE|nr:GL22402 [Drosophila persimilis]